ncbi:MAG TPA: hypothetical protein VM491_14150, partial [Burkholderiaceae bacterium]|nr:hypothetical protein [Burkholderiaceae bacterium]
METTALQSAGERDAATSRAARITDLTVRELVDAYMLAYAGRDTTRGHRMAWWAERIGDLPLASVTDDDVYFALEDLAAQRGRYWAGRDAEGKPIMKPKAKPLTPA